MKKYIVFAMVFLVLITCTGCLDKASRSVSSSSVSYSAGQSKTYTISSVSFNMHYVPAVSSFPTGTSDGGTASVNSAYWIAETEVTYELWEAVYTWAKSGTGGATGEGKYTFSNSGAEGSDSSSTQEPVTTINWRDAMVWCNALTEYYNAANSTSYKCVYYNDSAYAIPIRSTSDTYINSPYIYATATGNTDMANCTVNGFRLPTSNEWELAARYINGTTFYPGNYASGADAAYNVTSGGSDYDGDGDTQYTGDVAVYFANSNSVTAEVKSKSPNKLGLYDMSGNVWEWCFNWYTSGSYRVIRGGCWFSDDANDLQLGFVGVGEPDYADFGIGLRPVRTQ